MLQSNEVHGTKLISGIGLSIQKKFLWCFYLMMLFQFKLGVCEQDYKIINLPTKIFKISKTNQDIPIIQLSRLNDQLKKITLILDSGSSQLVLFDNQCQECLNTFSVCPHIKSFSNQTFINYISTQLRGDYSYISLSDQLRIRFFCVLKIQGQSKKIAANGILGTKIKNIFSSDVLFKQNIGIKAWIKILLKTYQKDIQQAELSNQIKNNIQKSMIIVKYSIFYTRYHTKLILGDMPQHMSKQHFAQFSFSQQIYWLNLSFFSELTYSNVVKKIDQSRIVYFDSGSSVIVLPQEQFEVLLEQLNEKVSNDCKRGDNKMIRCPKNCLKKLIQIGFHFQIQIYQRKNQNSLEQTILSIELQNLIQKTRSRHHQDMFSIGIISHLKQHQELKDSIILGTAIFKQYLIQFAINPLNGQMWQLSTAVHPLRIGYQNRLLIFDYRKKQNQQMMSPYQHLMAKFEKNIKIFILIYIFSVTLSSYLVIKFYWSAQKFIKGKRNIV